MVEMQTGKFIKCLFQLPNAKISSSDEEMFRKSHKPIRSFSVGTGLNNMCTKLKKPRGGRDYAVNFNMEKPSHLYFYLTYIDIQVCCHDLYQPKCIYQK